ncbi:septal ring lytic transglycosylase RlpA family protein [Shewanella litorisediminis]|uniref:Endolytic peptidoglycan transglycosylase RlpA n=1 Tax=Shewanella litorisediminis TaxID=1173586 RepID=A0ABX7G0S3_9GAMM|nr:septal ring lytic transglycosylase RlpA family protein [Shewanella litorisediminis]MCL2918066.1 septal ring lytic transglycosylase RlpA family protein [Shewanella litorisediminis]QRH00873.1 septal ring lytic transglycosylase RlpA family protein [Shewanella litorisediminis]
MPMPSIKSCWPLLAIALVLGGCSSSPEPTSSNKPSTKGDRYHQKHDAYPDSAPDVSQVPDAVPRYEPYSRGGNKPYSVMGKSYNVLASAANFRESGLASWYGTKFHGYHTSNGEVYDMYSMTAAHKTLPLPSFVRVRNLDNKKEVIVRVNDRGPFHEGRIIDLSYAAAYRLGMLNTGTARVEIETIYIPSPENEAYTSSQDPNHYFIQVVASKDKDRLNRLGKELADKYQLGYRLQEKDTLYRLQLGPLGHEGIASKMLQQMRQQGYPSGYLVTEPKS